MILKIAGIAGAVCGTLVLIASIGICHASSNCVAVRRPAVRSAAMIAWPGRANFSL